MPPPTAGLRAVLTLLSQAERECTARGNLATHPLDDQALWHIHAALAWIATQTLQDVVDPPVPLTAVTVPPTDLGPLELLTAAMEGILQLPDDLENAQLGQSRLDISDALSAVRAYCA